jgi:hypothetical protein
MQVTAENLTIIEDGVDEAAAFLDSLFLKWQLDSKIQLRSVLHDNA